MLNLTLIGNLGADPTVGATRKGTPIATLRVAVNHVQTDSTTGDRTESAEWFRVRAIGRLVDHAQRLTKGARVLVIDRLEISRYQSSEGEVRVGHDVWADELVSFSPRSDGDGNGRERRGHAQNQPAQPSTPPPAGSRAQHPERSQSAGVSRIQGAEDLPW